MRSPSSMMEEASKLEKLAGNPVTAVGAAMGAAAIGLSFPPFAIVSSAFAALITAPAGIRLKRRIEAAFKEINERFAENEAAIQNLTDGQHEFLILTLNTVLRTADERKIDLLKNAVKNGLKEPFDHYEAELTARVLNDMSFQEARFMIDSIQFRTIRIADRNLPGFDGLTIKHNSPERLIVAGLASLGVLMQSDTIALDVNSYQFSAISGKLVKLLTD